MVFPNSRSGWSPPEIQIERFIAKGVLQGRWQHICSILINRLLALMIPLELAFGYYEYQIGYSLVEIQCSISRFIQIDFAASGCAR